MKQTILTLTCVLALGSAQAQVAPKWADKAKKAVFSVVTYDADHKIMNTGNGFYIDANAQALSDYTLFKGAAEATVVTADGRQLNVGRIAGANSLYDVVKFRVDGDKKPASLTVAPTPAKVGEAVYLLPYSTSKEAQCQQGKVVSVDTIAGGHFYYTLEMKVTDKTVSCPLMNAQGEVVGMIQKGATDDTQAFAIGASYGAALNITALSAGDSNLGGIAIPKALPDDEDQALVYLFMAKSQLPQADYEQALDDLIASYPQNAEGYLRRGQWRLALSVADSTRTDLRTQAENDLNQSLKVAKDPAETSFDVARTYQSAGDYEKALQHIRTAIEKDSKPIYREQEGHILYAMGRYHEAAQSYSTVNATDQATPATLYAEAQAKRAEAEALSETDKTQADGLRTEALALMDSVIARYSKPYVNEAGPYFYERGAMKAEMGKHREAVMDFNEFEHIAGGRVTAAFYWEREQSEAQCRMYQQALDDLDSALKLAPRDGALLVEKGSMQLRVGQKEEAIATLRKAVALDNEDALACRLLGYALTQDKKTQSEGCTYLQRAKELGDDTADGLIQKYCK